MPKQKKPTPKKPTRAKTQSPRSQPLPGMEAVRSRRLDNLCESIGDERDTMNSSRKEEQKLIVAALQEMQTRGVTVYRHARIELVRVPGAEKLRVRVTKEEGDAGAADLTPAEPTPVADPPPAASVA